MKASRVLHDYHYCRSLIAAFQGKGLVIAGLIWLTSYCLWMQGMRIRLMKFVFLLLLRIIKTVLRTGFTTTVLSLSREPLDYNTQ
jgi:hypothetical protein